MLLQRLVHFALALPKHRLRSNACYERGRPGKFAALLSAEHAPATLKLMELHWGEWQRAQLQKGSFWVQLQRRSVFQQLSVMKVAAWH
jgi:hypothetical protein